MKEIIFTYFFEYRRKIKQTVNATRKNTLIKALIEVTISHVIKVCVLSNNDGYARLEEKDRDVQTAIQLCFGETNGIQT